MNKEQEDCISRCGMSLASCVNNGMHPNCYPCLLSFGMRL